MTQTVTETRPAGLGDVVIRDVFGARPDGPWRVVRDLRDARGVFVLESVEYAGVTVHAYPQSMHLAAWVGE